MNILLKHRYFRRECFAHTWVPSCLAKHLPAKAWYLDYISNITNIDIIWKLCEIGDLPNMKKLMKCTYYELKPIELKYGYWDTYICYKYSYDPTYIDRKSIVQNNTHISIGLMVSCFYGHLPMVQYLIEQGANIHFGNDIPLQWSAHKGHLPIVQYLVEQGANIHADNTLLQMAADNGHLPVVQYLVEKGVDIHTDDEGALRWSIENNQWEVAKYLVAQGANTSVLTPEQLEKMNSLA